MYNKKNRKHKYLIIIRVKQYEVLPNIILEYGILLVSVITNRVHSNKLRLKKRMECLSFEICGFTIGAGHRPSANGLRRWSQIVIIR